MCLKRHRCWAVLVVLSWPLGASARNVEPGRLHLGGGLGPGLNVGGRLGVAPADLLLTLQGDWTWSRLLGTTGAASFGLGGSEPVLGRLGMRLRAHSLGLAISPYAQAELVGGGLLRVLGSRQRFFGSRLGGGVDYFATGNVTVGVGLGVVLGSTLGERPAFYGLVDASLYVTVALNRGLGAAATTQPGSQAPRAPALAAGPSPQSR